MYDFEKLWRGGASVAQISRATGLSPATVRRRLNQAGIQLRIGRAPGSGRINGGATDPDTDRRRQEAIDLYLERAGDRYRYTVGEIAEKLGVGLRTATGYVAGLRREMKKTA